MFVSLLNRKEKLKFLDLAKYMIDIDGAPTDTEKKLLKTIFAEVNDISEEYTFTKSASKEETIEFFKNSTQPVKNIIFLNLITITLNDEFYNTSEFNFLAQIQDAFGISEQKRHEIMGIIYEERDLQEAAKRVINYNA